MMSVPNMPGAFSVLPYVSHRARLVPLGDELLMWLEHVPLFVE